MHQRIEHMSNTMIRRLVLDVLKPHVPTILDLATALTKVRGVTGVNLSLYEVDQQTETVKATIQGENIDYDGVVDVIRNFGGAIHSIDEVVAGREIVKEYDLFTLERDINLRTQPAVPAAAPPQWRVR